jgi:hypothetical protein
LQPLNRNTTAAYLKMNTLHQPMTKPETGSGGCTDIFESGKRKCADFQKSVCPPELIGRGPEFRSPRVVVKALPVNYSNWFWGEPWDDGLPKWLRQLKQEPLRRRQEQEYARLDAEVTQRIYGGHQVRPHFMDMNGLPFHPFNIDSISGMNPGTPEDNAMAVRLIEAIGPMISRYELDPVTTESTIIVPHRRLYYKKRPFVTNPCAEFEISSPQPLTLYIAHPMSPATETPAIGQVTRIEQAITHQPNPGQVDAYTMEKALEVNRITTTHALEHQIKEKEQQSRDLFQAGTKIINELKVEITSAELKRLRRSADIKALAKLLSKLMAVQVTAAGVVESVVLCSQRPGGNSFSDESLFNEEGTQVGMEITLSVVAKALATPAAVVDADSDLIGEDYQGRKTITTNGWFRNYELSPAQRIQHGKWRGVCNAQKIASREREELQLRLNRVGKQSEALKAQILKDQIATAPGGQKVLEMLDKVQQATVNGEYLALL